VRLTFDEGQFQLYFSEPISPKNPIPEKFQRLRGSNILVTRDYRAARTLSAYADDKAKTVLSKAFVDRYAMPACALPEFLDAHQKEGVTHILTRSRSYLAHAAGAGKTAQAIVSAMMCDAFGQAVFIVPPSLTLNWARECEKFFLMVTKNKNAWPDIAVIPETDRKDYAGWNADFLIVPDSMISTGWVMEKLQSLTIKFLAVDEASRFKDSSASRSIALYGGQFKIGKHAGKKSAGLIFKARHTVFMDGSPMPNRPMELWAPTFALSPETIDFMPQNDFGFRYCGAKQNAFGQWEFKHSSHERELNERLIGSGFMHVVSESALNHPERLRTMQFLNKDLRSTEHKKWEKANLARIDLKAVMSERGPISVHSERLSGELAHYRRELGVRKIKAVSAYVKDKLDDKGESILVFAHHREVCEGLALALKEFKPALVMGGTDARLREEYFSAFNSGSLKVIVGNIAVMSRGHNLQRANRGVFCEWSWCDETNIQCEKRYSRRGSEHVNVRSDYMVAPNSLDEVILGAMFRKSETVAKVIK